MQEIKKRNVNKKITEKNNIENNKDERKNSNTLNSRNNLSLRIISRVVVIFSLLIIVYFSSKDEKLEPFAKQSELLPGKGQIIECSPDYLKELNKYEGCFPKACKRFVTDKVISEREVDELLAIAKKGLKLGGSSGGASILDLHSGALSKGEHFINIYSKEEAKNLFTEHDFNIYTVVKEKVKTAVAHHFGVKPSKVYLTHPTFFSEISAKRAVTVHDEYWHPHVDKETYQSFHYTTLLYLGDYDKDFKGGRFKRRRKSALR